MKGSFGTLYRNVFCKGLQLQQCRNPWRKRKLEQRGSGRGKTCRMAVSKPYRKIWRGGFGESCNMLQQFGNAWRKALKLQWVSVSGRGETCISGRSGRFQGGAKCAERQLRNPTERRFWG